MSSYLRPLIGTLALTLAALARAQGPVQPLPIFVTLFPTTLGTQQAVGLQLGLYDWDMSISLPRPAAMQGLNLRLDRLGDESVARTSVGASVGAAWRTSLGRVGVNYRIDTGALNEPNPARSFGVTYGYAFRSGLKLSTSLDRGLNEAGPRWGGGLTITYSH